VGLIFSLFLLGSPSSQISYDTTLLYPVPRSPACSTSSNSSSK
jgi:hypothetical protein